MIHVDKHALAYLGIEKIAIKESGNVYSCVPVFFFQEAWQLYCITELFPMRGQDSILITYQGQLLSCPVCLTGVCGKRRHYTAVFHHRLPLELEYKLRFLQSRFESADKRSERRFPLGVAYWALIGFKQLYQTVLIDGYEYDCIIENIAEHGILLSLRQEGRMNIRSPMGLRLTFTDPSLISFLYLSPVRYDKKNGRLYIAACIKEPVDIHYRMRIARYTNVLTDDTRKRAIPVGC